MSVSPQETLRFPVSLFSRLLSEVNSLSSKQFIYSHHSVDFAPPTLATWVSAPDSVVTS